MQIHIEILSNDKISTCICIFGDAETSQTGQNFDSNCKHMYMEYLWSFFLIFAIKGYKT